MKEHKLYSNMFTDLNNTIHGMQLVNFKWKTLHEIRGLKEHWTHKNAPMQLYSLR